MCDYRDFDKFPEEFYRKLQAHLKSIMEYTNTEDAVIAGELLVEAREIQLKILRRKHFNVGIRRKVISRLEITQILAIQKAVVRVLKANILLRELTPEEHQELATEIVITLDAALS